MLGRASAPAASERPPADGPCVQRLVEDRMCDVLPCILGTGKGHPDIGTR